jgi:hypothetical protein
MPASVHRALMIEDTGQKIQVNRATNEGPVRHIKVSFLNAWKNQWLVFSAFPHGQARKGIVCHEDETSGV